MQMIQTKPTIEMSVEEWEAIRKFIEIFNNLDNQEAFFEYDWTDIIEDFPLEKTDFSECGAVYNIRVID